MNTKIKICGIKNSSEIKLLDDFGVSYSGLWYGIPKGPHNLTLKQLIDLSSIPTQNTQHLLVTMKQDIAFLGEAIEKSDVCGIQFHGFQSPAFIKKIKSTFGDSLKIFKVLHIKDEKCVEEPFIDRYLESGTDILILDSYQDKEKVGSTGIRIKDTFIEQFLSQRSLRGSVMIAGGMDESNINSTCIKHHPYGIDIDSAARIKGNISENKIRQIMAQRTSLKTSIGSTQLLSMPA